MEITSQHVGLTIGWLLVGWVGIQAAVATLRALSARRRRQRDFEQQRAQFRRTVEAAARAARATKAITDWEGWRQFRVVAVVDEAVDVKSFYFTPVDSRPLLPFAPGQFLTFRLPIEGNNGGLVRCYSLSDRPRQDYYRATIKRLGNPPNDPTIPCGRGSSYFHDRVRVGDVLDVRAPSGTFLLDPLAHDAVVLLGAGIGVTPLVSMLEAYAQSGRRREVYAVFGFRNSGEHPFKAHLERLAHANPWLHLHTSYSAPLTQDVLYRDYNHHGRIDIDRLRVVLPSNNFHFYVCGPGPLMESLVPALWDWGVPESHVHFEAFGPASVRSASQCKSEVAEPCNVRFERSDRGAVWDGSFNSLLELGEAAGITMPSGCRAGNCGECMLAVCDGGVTAFKTPGVTVPAGYCLPCISAPAGELVLDI